MAKTALPSLPGIVKQLDAQGLRLRLARERRKISQELFAERVGVSRETLRRMEKGNPSIAMATFMRALRVLGLDRDIDPLAADDELGRKLQDLELPAKPGATRLRGRHGHRPSENLGSPPRRRRAAAPHPRRLATVTARDPLGHQGERRSRPAGRRGFMPNESFKGSQAHEFRP